MSVDHRDKLAKIRKFPQLIAYLRDEMDWPIEQDSFDSVDDLFFKFTPDELGIDPKNAAKIQEIKRLRPLSTKQPWGIFFVKFEPKKLPVVALRRLLSQVALKKRASSNNSDRAAWSADDLLFISNYGDGESRQISFAHFSQDKEKNDLPTLKVLGWDNRDTDLHLDHVAESLTERLAWPENEDDIDLWGNKWRSAFTLGHREAINTSKKLSVELAHLARNIRDRINTVLAIETENGPITKLMSAFKEALVHDLDEDGFADMYAQTIAYGLLSSRIANPTGDNADELPAAMPITSPFLKELMETFLHVGGRKGKAGKGSGLDFDELGVSDVIELLDEANMEAVVRDFGDKNPQEDPVIHFYELFLKEYDAEKRMSRGVFYTPRPVVSFIVRSVDELLRTDFGLVDGLADTTTWGEMAKRIDDLEIPEGVTPDQAFVQILDPATGTGTFLVETINIIHKTMTEKWKEEGKSKKKINELWNEYVPKHLLPRLHGYELMMAPYAIAHMKIGLKLLETGYNFESEERAKVYLTNALEPAQEFSDSLAFAIPALAHESTAVNSIKQHQRFTVIIGNPPYSGVSSNMNQWSDDLLKGRLPGNPGKRSYYEVAGEPLGERKVWLQDDYVKFIRFGEWTIETTGCGLQCLISNHGYLDNPTFRGMRWSIIDSFDKIHVLDLHGNLMKKEITPNGEKDINVFDIQQGVGVGIFVRNCNHQAGFKKHCVHHADLWGEREVKYQWLINHSVTDIDWQNISAAKPFYLFEPFDQSEAGDYYDWSSINEILHTNVTGVVTARDGFVIDLDEEMLINRISTYLDIQHSDEFVRDHLGLSENYAWRVNDSRDQLRKAVGQSNLEEFVKPILYRPFDTRKIFWHPSVVWRPRSKAMPHMLAGDNLGLIFMRQVAQGDSYTHFGISRLPVDNRAFYSNKGIMSFAPLYLYPGIGNVDASMFNSWSEGKNGRRPNIDHVFIEAFASSIQLQFVSDGSGDLRKTFGPEDVLAYIYAIFHSPEYRRRFEPMLKLDFPRVPHPTDHESFASLVPLGREILGLHLLESPTLNNPIAKYNGPANPEVDKAIYTPKTNTVWLDKGKTYGFVGVPEEVWNFHIGGYQVCHKWLKDRQAKGGKNPRPGRKLTQEDINHYQKIIVALSETIRIMAEIDQVIDAHGGWPDAFVTDSSD